MALGNKSGKNKTKEASKKRKVPNDAIKTTAKRTKTPDNPAPASGSKESSATPAPATVCSRHTTVMSEEEEEDAAMHGEDTIYVSGDESEAESSEAELRE